METAPKISIEGQPPLHVAIIMDGNGRWARARGLPRSAGHRKGVEALRRVVEAAPGLGITHLTLYSFSSENWRRPAAEVRDLMGLLRFHLRSETEELERNNVRLQVIGDRAGLSDDIVRLIEGVEEQTRRNTGLTMVMALNYGGRASIAAAARRVAERVAAGDLDPAAIDADSFGAALETAALPPPDLLIRTGGEKRISNFLLWELAYTEFVFFDTYWPDFSSQELEHAVFEFRGRERRFGAVGV